MRTSKSAHGYDGQHLMPVPQTHNTTLRATLKHKTIANAPPQLVETHSSATAFTMERRNVVVIGYARPRKGDVFLLTLPVLVLELLGSRRRTSCRNDLSTASLSLRSTCQVTTISSTPRHGQVQTICRTTHSHPQTQVGTASVTSSDYSVSMRETKAADWDKQTWPFLADLAQNHPEAGVHFQGTTPKRMCLVYCSS